MPDEATVTVEIPATPEVREPVESPETVTVITPPVNDTGTDSATVNELLEQRERTVRAELRNEQLEQQIAELQASVARAQATAEVASAEVQEVVSTVEEIAEGEAISPDTDIEPTREHPFWRHI